MQHQLFSGLPAEQGGGGSILSKIASVKPANDQRVSPTDIAVCERYQARYFEVKKNLQQWEDIFSTATKNFYDGNVKVERYSSGELHVKVPDRFSKNVHLAFEYNDYDAVKGWEIIDKKLRELQEAFVSKVMEYFNSTYHLDLETTGLGKKPIEDYKIIIDHIFAATGGLDLSDHGFRTLVNEAVSQLIYNYKDKPIVVGNKVNFGYLSPFDGYGDKNFPYSLRHSKTFAALVNSLAWFEDGHLNDAAYRHGWPWGEHVDYSSTYDLSGDKVIKAKFYKNGKAIIYFSDATAAAEYFNMFQLYTVKS